MTKDLQEDIYTAKNLNPKDFFIELHGTEIMQTVLVVVHKSKVPIF